MSEKNKGSGGISALWLLGIAFIVLKLCGVITWSWPWVLAPLWGGVALEIAILLIGVKVWRKKYRI